MFSPAVQHQLVAFAGVEAKSSRRMWVEAGVNADTGYESPLKVDVSNKKSNKSNVGNKPELGLESWGVNRALESHLSKPISDVKCRGRDLGI